MEPPCCYSVEHSDNILTSLVGLDDTYKYVSETDEVVVLGAQVFHRRILEKISDIAYNLTELLLEIPNPCYKCVSIIKSLELKLLQIGMKVYTIHNNESRI